MSTPTQTIIKVDDPIFQNPKFIKFCKLEFKDFIHDIEWQAWGKMTHDFKELLTEIIEGNGKLDHFVYEHSKHNIAYISTENATHHDDGSVTECDITTYYEFMELTIKMFHNPNNYFISDEQKAIAIEYSKTS